MTTTVRLLLGLLCLCCVGTGCAAAADVTRQPTLVGVLLIASDLPPGFEEADPEPPMPLESDRPECASTLDQLEVVPADEPGVAEERILFRNVTKTVVQHVVRQYPDSVRAAAEVTRARTVLADCVSFEVHFPGDGLSLTETVRPISAPATANPAWAAEVTVTGQGATLTNTLVLIQQGPLLSVVSVFTPFGPEPELVARAVSTVDQRMAS
ncbi:hypothetical protein [Actinomycetospora cinnamomea]|uniref:PknH-like protein n=1 Tax=Actinomycetospora cinnamomea TaxID=663609 RepID=A0A2U1EX98_9PSEU|nr:hypothetical protein [Actinomycetospora cinnamomea]PVZ04554.1 hypothetical protein C8D89_1177 [Actinomycetospora cinnamomea]